MIAVATSRRLAFVAALALALAGLLPAPHAHLDRDDTIVHVHAVADSPLAHPDDGPEHDHATFDHGDHAHASTVRSSYDIAARFVLKVTTVASATAFDMPQPVGIRQPRRTTLMPTHDPPLRFTSSPAPPAVV